MFEIELFICIKRDSALNNQQWFICHKTKPNQTKPRRMKKTEKHVDNAYTECSWGP